MMDENHITAQNRHTDSTPPPKNATEIPANLYEALPTTTSIRLLEVLDSSPDDIRCRMRIIDLEDEPNFAALSYTWGNPATIYDEPMPDISQFRFPEDVDQIPFAYRTSPLGPDGETLLGIDDVKADYLSRNPRIPYEKVAWKSGNSRQISVNDRAVEVEENLFDYLTYVTSSRRRFAERGDDGYKPLLNLLRLPIWIDALCIDQLNLSERTAQVQLMGRIYKSAENVLAWVGQADDLCAGAFRSISNILDWELTHMDDVYGEGNYDKPKRREQDHITLSSVPGMTVVHWFALFVLLQRLWFRRAWIAQEAILSKDLILICGGNSVHFSLLLAVLTILEETGLDYELCHMGQSLLTGRPFKDPTLQLQNFSAVEQTWEQVGPANELRQLSVDPSDVYSFVLGFHRVRGCLGLSEVGKPLLQRCESSGKGTSEFGFYNAELQWEIKLKDTILEEIKSGIFSHRKRSLRLLSILSDFRNLDASDPRDKIFAFLNLATDNLNIVPDYRASVEDVFLDATKQMIIQYNSLSVLSHCQDPADNKIFGPPGWVPDFSVKLGHYPFDTGDEVSDFLASGYLTSPHFDFCPDGSLEVEGIRVDTVSFTTDLEGDAILKILTLLLRVPAQYPVIPLGWWSKEKANNRSCRELHPRVTCRIEALWRTLIADALTEVEVYTDGPGSRDWLAAGFRTWIIADILEARNILAQYANEDDLAPWARDMIFVSFRTRMAVWSALYERQQIVGDSLVNVPGLEATLNDLTLKQAEEDQLYCQFSEHSELQQPTIGLEHFPTATQISQSFKKKTSESGEDQEEVGEEEQGISLVGNYRTDTLQRLTSLERRQIRGFEKQMRKTIERRRLLCSSNGLLGLGPMSTAQDEARSDEIWILRGARVPFILRQISDNRYQIIGEAYVHGLMYGEASDFLSTEFWSDLRGDMCGSVPDCQMIHLV